MRLFSVFLTPVISLSLSLSASLPIFYLPFFLSLSLSYSSFLSQLFLHELVAAFPDKSNKGRANVREKMFCKINYAVAHNLSAIIMMILMYTAFQVVLNEVD